MERDLFGTRTVLLHTSCICAVPGKEEPRPVTEFHGYGLSVRDDEFPFTCTLSTFSITVFIARGTD